MQQSLSKKVIFSISISTLPAAETSTWADGSAIIQRLSGLDTRGPLPLIVTFPLVFWVTV
jgi:hypothetical protein